MKNSEKFYCALFFISLMISSLVVVKTYSQIIREERQREKKMEVPRLPQRYGKDGRALLPVY